MKSSGDGLKDFKLSVVRFVGLRLWAVAYPKMLVDSLVAMRPREVRARNQSAKDKARKRPRW